MNEVGRQPPDRDDEGEEAVDEGDEVDAAGDREPDGHLPYPEGVFKSRFAMIS